MPSPHLPWLIPGLTNGLVGLSRRASYPFGEFLRAADLGSGIWHGQKLESYHFGRAAELGRASAEGSLPGRLHIACLDVAHEPGDAGYTTGIRQGPSKYRGAIPKAAGGISDSARAREHGGLTGAGGGQHRRPFPGGMSRYGVQEPQEPQWSGIRMAWPITGRHPTCRSWAATARATMLRARLRCCDNATLLCSQALAACLSRLKTAARRRWRAGYSGERTDGRRVVADRAWPPMTLLAEQHAAVASHRPRITSRALLEGRRAFDVPLAALHACGAGATRRELQFQQRAISRDARMRRAAQRRAGLSRCALEIIRRGQRGRC